MLSARLAARTGRAPLPTLRWLPLLFLLAASTAFAPPAFAQKDEDEMEKFEEVDPYTKGDRELELKLGYSKFGFVPWRNAEDSKSVQENMGGIPMLWVETEHFLIGSSLVTYKIPNDREERERIKDEIGRLKKKLGKLRAPKKELDPYLRLHLYAQRAEDQYAAFVKDMGLDAEQFTKKGTHLGHKDKFRLILCQRKSEFGRYVRTYEQQDIEYSYRTGWRGEGMLVAANVEAIAEHWKGEDDAPIDSMFHCLVTHSLANNFIDGYEQQLFQAPTWLVFGLGHLYTKRIDPRWTFFDGRKVIYDRSDDAWDWYSRVTNLVKNDFFASAEEMFAWKAYGDLGPREHMVAWSKVEYLLTEVEGDKAKFLSLACRSTGNRRKQDDTQAPELVTRQTHAMSEALGITPAKFDEEWATWVERTYKRK